MSKNSQFHTELLDFLLQSCQKQIDEEGINPNDPEIRTLLKNLSAPPAEAPLPLTEIIEGYQHLFGARGPIHIEKTLLEAFPPKDLPGAPQTLLSRSTLSIPHQKEFHASPESKEGNIEQGLIQSLRQNTGQRESDPFYLGDQ